MAHYYTEPSHTFSEYLLIPGYTSEDCIPDNVSLRTPLVRYRKGQEECPICLNIPMTSAIMQSVSNDTLAIALAKEGGLSFIYGSQSIESEAEMVRRVKSHKAGFVVSASNLTPEHTLADVLALKEKNGFSTVAITENAQPNGKLLGIVTSRDYRVSRMCVDTKVRDFMTPRERLITAPSTTTLREANDLIWEHKLNALPIVDENDCILCSGRIIPSIRSTRWRSRTRRSAIWSAQASTPAIIGSASRRWWRRARTCCASTPRKAIPSGRSA